MVACFLGPKYDHVLEEVYTQYSTDDLIEERILSGLISGDALTDTSKLEAILESKVTPDFLAAIAEEHRKGRLLLVGTTNLDAGRPMIWNMGAIAATGHPDAPHLFRQVVLASASIPVAFRRRSSRLLGRTEPFTTRCMSTAAPPRR